MLYARYCAFFDESEKDGRYHLECALSLLSAAMNLAPYVEVEFVVYTLGKFRASITKLFSSQPIRSRIIALDEEFPEKYSENRAFANSLSNLTDVDRHCVVRMLTDFDVLDSGTYRLLLGTDVFFLSCPQEVLHFVWAGAAEHRAKVLYMRDGFSFSGADYKLRYFHPPILNGLLGDFYCLAPGVALTREAIMGCLRMIDGWPVLPDRFDPPLRFNLGKKLGERIYTTPEQQAASILLAPFGGESLPREHYAHETFMDSLAVLHTHNFERAMKCLNLG